MAAIIMEQMLEVDCSTNVVASTFSIEFNVMVEIMTMNIELGNIEEVVKGHS